MEKPLESYIKVPANTVIEACEKFLQAELERHQYNQECVIRDKMKGGWFRPKMDRDAAIETLYGKTWNDVQTLKYIGEYRINRMFELLELSKMAAKNDGLVYLYASDANVLNKF